jgi:hypothetical protein
MEVEEPQPGLMRFPGWGLIRGWTTRPNSGGNDQFRGLVWTGGRPQPRGSVGLGPDVGSQSPEGTQRCDPPRLSAGCPANFWRVPFVSMALSGPDLNATRGAATPEPIYAACDCRACVDVTRFRWPSFITASMWSACC